MPANACLPHPCVPSHRAGRFGARTAFKLVWCRGTGVAALLDDWANVLASGKPTATGAVPTGALPDAPAATGSVPTDTPAATGADAAAAPPASPPAAACAVAAVEDDKFKVGDEVVGISVKF